MNSLQNYYKKSLSYSNFRYILEISLIGILLKIIVGIIAGLIIEILPFHINMDDNFEYREFSLKILLIFMVFIVPILETLTNWLPIYILNKITNNYIVILLITALLFSIFHISYSFYYSLLMFPVGLTFAWAFYCKYKISFMEAFFTTSAIHGIHNLVAVIFIIAGR